MPTAARYADEWNGWCTPDEFRAKRVVLDRLCEAIDRDPADDPRLHPGVALHERRPRVARPSPAENAGRPLLIGNAAEIADQVAAYAAPGVDELIIPDWTLGPPARSKDVCDQIITEIAAPFR